HRAGGARAPGGVPLAGQRARAAQRDRAHGDHVRRGDRRARPAALPRRPADSLLQHPARRRRPAALPAPLAARLPRRGRARVPAPQARRAGLEHLALRAGAGHRADQPAQAPPLAGHREREVRALALLLLLAGLARADEESFYRGAALEREGKLEEAIAELRGIVDRTPGDAFADDALLEMARIYDERL